MKVLVFVKATKESEAGEMPSEKLLTEMGRYNEELVKAGIMLGGEGLQPSSKAARVVFNGDKRSVIDGPFAESKEIVGGYAFMEFPSHSAAVASATQFMELHREHWPGWEGEVEVRQVIPCGSECPTE